MGFFSKLKQNVNHGGVKVSVEAPNTVNLKDVSFEVRVTISSSDSTQTIKGIRVALQEQTEAGDSGPPMRDITSIENTEPFVLQPGESKTITVQVPLNAGKNIEQVLAAEHPGLAQAANMLGKAEDLANFKNNMKEREYYLNASADVEGIAMDPAKSIPIQVLRPGQIGGSINAHS
jgi:sporulation-control protein spo0M